MKSNRPDETRRGDWKAIHIPASGKSLARPQAKPSMSHSSVKRYRRMSPLE